MQPESIIVENKKKKSHLKLKNPWKKMPWSSSGHEDTVAMNEVWCERENGWWGDGFPWVREMKRKGERRGRGGGRPEWGRRWCRISSAGSGKKGKKWVWKEMGKKRERGSQTLK